MLDESTLWPGFAGLFPHSRLFSLSVRVPPSLHLTPVTPPPLFLCPLPPQVHRYTRIHSVHTSLRLQLKVAHSYMAAKKHEQAEELALKVRGGLDP